MSHAGLDAVVNLIHTDSRKCLDSTDGHKLHRSKLFLRRVRGHVTLLDRLTPPVYAWLSRSQLAVILMVPRVFIFNISFIVYFVSHSSINTDVANK